MDVTYAFLDKLLDQCQAVLEALLSMHFHRWYGLQNCFVGLFYGCLREGTDSVVAGGVTHGLVNVLARVSVMISRG